MRHSRVFRVRRGQRPFLGRRSTRMERTIRGSKKDSIRRRMGVQSKSSRIRNPRLRRGEQENSMKRNSILLKVLSFLGIYAYAGTISVNLGAAVSFGLLGGTISNSWSSGVTGSVGATTKIT